MTAPKRGRPHPLTAGLPITISAHDALRNLDRAQRMDARRLAGRLHAARYFATAGSAGSTGPAGPAKSSSQSSSELAPGGGGAAGEALGDVFLLEVTAIDGYDHNPRQFINERREDIRAGIEALGFHDVMVVTRRDARSRYMLAAGSNTTLSVIKELWQQTCDERFRWVRCIAQAYEGEVRLMAQHLAENLNRGAMKFWEVASGMLGLCDLLGQERLQADPLATPPSVRELCTLLASRGLVVDIGRLTRWRFAVQRLQALGPATKWLTERHIKVIQPRVMCARNLAAKFHMAEVEFWGHVVEPVLERHGQLAAARAAEFVFDAELLCADIELAFAGKVGEAAPAVAQMLSLLKLAPVLTLAELRAPTGAASHSPATAPAPSANRLAPNQAESMEDGAASAPPLQPPRPASKTSGPSPRPSTPAVDLTASPAPTAQGSLFQAGSSGTDPLIVLHDKVRVLLAHCGLEDTLRWWDDMPLGFFLELPDPQRHRKQQVKFGSPELQDRHAKTAVWWNLVSMTGQFCEGCVPFIDRKSLFYRTYRSEYAYNPLQDTDLGDAPTQVDEVLGQRVSPGRMRQAMTLVREVEQAAADMLEQLPERWLRMQQVRGQGPGAGAGHAH